MALNALKDMKKKAPGAFKPEKAKRTKAWKVNEDLLEGICHVIPIHCSVVDIGAGIGLYVKALRDLGWKIGGLDAIRGIEEITEGLVTHFDLSVKPPTPVPLADWGLCLEVGEHIPAKFDRVVFDNIASLAREGLVISWARPGQRGRGHVNCKHPEEVAIALEKRGWSFDAQATTLIRSQVGRKMKHVMVLKL